MARAPSGASVRAGARAPTRAPARAAVRFLALLLLSALALPGAGAESLLLSAASSLAPLLGRLQPSLSRAAGLEVRINSGASGSLRAQIEAGAPVDLYISADPADLDRLEARGLLLSGSRAPFLKNSLVLIGPPAAPSPASAGRLPASPASSPEAPLKLLASSPLLAIGNPATVPAGRHALELLEGLGLASELRGRLVYAGSVREVLEFVRRGAAPLGLVYLTDALEARGGVELLWRVPETGLARQPSYELGIPASSARAEAARRLSAWLCGVEGRAAFLAAGFLPP